MEKLFGCISCSCQEKCNCVETSIKTQIILYVHSKQKRTEKNSQLANKPKYINIQPSMRKQQSLQQAQSKKLNSTNKKSRISVNLHQTKHQLTHSKNTSIFSRNTENQNPNSSFRNHKTSPKNPHTIISNHTMVMAPKLSQMLELRLIDQDNQHLKKELARLKREQKQLLTTKKQMKNKFAYDIKCLTANSQQIKQKSCQRRKQIKELQQLLQWKKHYKFTSKKAEISESDTIFKQNTN